jgi:hypothetical protein
VVQVGATTPVPAKVLAELPAEEPVFKSAPARLSAGPTSRETLRGAAVLTAARLSFVPGDAPAEPSNDPIRILLGELWQLVKPALLDAFPIVQLIAARQRGPAPLAGRGRPAIEVPLQMLDGVFVAGASPGWLGLRIALPEGDPRPPFTLYLELGEQEAADWHDLCESARATARPRPELERPYALYYLFRPLPSPNVFVQRGAPAREGRHESPLTEVGRGRLVLGPDGPALAKSAPSAILPYEAVERVEIAHATKWRSGWIDLVTAEVAFDFLAPRSDQRTLEDFARLVSELSGAPVVVHPGPVAVGRVAFRAAWLTAAGAGLAELAHLIFF